MLLAEVRGGGHAPIGVGLLAATHPHPRRCPPLPAPSFMAGTGHDLRGVGAFLSARFHDCRIAFDPGAAARRIEAQAVRCPQWPIRRHRSVSLASLHERRAYQADQGRRTYRRDRFAGCQMSVGNTALPMSITEGSRVVSRRDICNCVYPFLALVLMLRSVTVELQQENLGTPSAVKG
jgi:hypothetical protein